MVQAAGVEGLVVVENMETTWLWRIWRVEEKLVGRGGWCCLPAGVVEAVEKAAYRGRSSDVGRM